ncbi:MAG: 4-(cytidine 5'-diphospho)-2-C-methyl-D-erythritol kinase [Alphaproteobacteria bacterium]|nr:4-(cytidine 5'-diphospho)-2-C-methyl-D-erythritol kinase [Alphaproteobacteria bacterium]
MRFFASAKVNLTLRIVGRRADGYHLLQSLMAPTDMGDVLHIEPAEGYMLRVEGPYAHHAPAGEGNLVTCAVRAMEAKAVRPAGMDVRLRKNVPAGAGLGGGSADAAAAMHALNALWGSPFDMDALCAIGLGLGAELPFMLRGVPARVEGIGEVQVPASGIGALPAVLVWPNAVLPTAEVFKAYRENGKAFSSPHTDIDIASGMNDLTDAAKLLCPAIAGALEALGGAVYARMSGSGSACFGVYADMDSAMDAAQKISGAKPDWWARACMINPKGI